MADLIYGIHDGQNIIRWTMKPQTEGLFVSCDVNELHNKKFVNGELKNLTANEKKARDIANYAALRMAEYGEIGAQLDEIYKDIDAWKTRIAAIKAKYPKA